MIKRHRQAEATSSLTLHNERCITFHSSDR